MNELDLRPGRLNLLFRPGNTIRIEMTWPADALDSLDLSAFLGEDELAVGVVGDVATVVASSDITEDLTGAVSFRLLTGEETLMSGLWVASSSATDSPDQTVTVNVSESVPVVVTVNGDAVTGFELDEAVAALEAADALLIPLAQKAAANGVATLGSDLKIPSAQLPALAINDTFVVASQAAMLALTAQRGDMAVRTDLNKTFVLSTDSPGTLADWIEVVVQLPSTLAVAQYGSDTTTARPSAGTVIWVGYDGYWPANINTATDIVLTRAGPDVAPAVPSSFTATPGNALVALDWADNTELDLDHYDYRVNGGSPVSTALVSSVTLTGLTNDVSYTFEVRAVDIGGHASAWASTTATPTDIAPAVPSGLTATGLDASAALDWADNTEPDLARYDYRVNGGSPVSTGTTSSATVTGLTNGTTYSFEVRAVDVGGHASAWSSAVTATPAVFNPITQVAAIHAVWASDPAWTPPADGAVVASWRDGGSGATNFVQATAGAKPLYRASVAALNNKPAVDFDGVDDTLVASTLAIAQPFKELLVVKVDTVPGINIVGHGTGSANGIGCGSSKWNLSNGTVIAEAVASVNTSAHQLRATSNGASSQLWRDGTSIATGDSGASGVTANTLRLGAGGTGSASRWTDCQIAFYGIYDGATSDADLATLGTALRAYYGIA